MEKNKWQMDAEAICVHLPFKFELAERSGRNRLRVLPPNRLNDQPRLDRLGAHLDPNNLPVNHRAHLLNIRPKLPSRNTRDLRANAAQILRFAAMRNLVAEGRLLAVKVTNAGHCLTS